jgi:hypothetical protein
MKIYYRSILEHKRSFIIELFLHYFIFAFPFFTEKSAVQSIEQYSKTNDGEKIQNSSFVEINIEEQLEDNLLIVLEINPQLTKIEVFIILLIIGFFSLTLYIILHFIKTSYSNIENISTENFFENQNDVKIFANKNDVKIFENQNDVKILYKEYKELNKKDILDMIFDYQQQKSLKDIKPVSKVELFKKKTKDIVIPFFINEYSNEIIKKRFGKVDIRHIQYSMKDVQNLIWLNFLNWIYFAPILAIKNLPKENGGLKIFFAKNNMLNMFIPILILNRGSNELFFLIYIYTFINSPYYVIKNNILHILFLTFVLNLGGYNYSFSICFFSLYKFTVYILEENDLLDSTAIVLKNIFSPSHIIMFQYFLLFQFFEQSAKIFNVLYDTYNSSSGYINNKFLKEYSRISTKKNSKTKKKDVYIFCIMLRCKKRIKNKIIDKEEKLEESTDESSENERFITPQSWLSWVKEYIPSRLRF